MHSRFLASTLHAVAGSSEERPAAESPLAQTLLISKSHFILDLGPEGPRIRRWLKTPADCARRKRNGRQDHQYFQGHG
ncbi:hypothetical protein AGR9A_Cc70124 [Agrobacterium salinitolerans str. Hayward 0363]|nr:hypothetical protein AGR9A_Cc70124 [Agrobacterium salinitolerans str. Hayward 0363]